jgi:UDP-N-acetyl-D-glucosamine dehydrogenase
MPFLPGPGVGGSCIPKDPMYLYWRAKRLGSDSRFIRLASEVISSMPKYIVERLEALLREKRSKELENSKVLIVGVTYKRDVKDLRRSPILEIIRILQSKKVKVSYYDPYIPYLRINGINLKSSRLTGGNLKNFDCVVIGTDHKSIDYSLILRKANLIFDTRGVYNKFKIQNSKFKNKIVLL